MTPPPAPVSVSIPAAKPPLPQSAIAGAQRYGFAGAELGTPLEIWRASRKDSDGNACSSRGGGHLVVCQTRSVPLGGSCSANDITYTFLDGRLAQISFKTSTNAFDFATASLKHSFGEPARIVRDSTTVQDGMKLPHVMMVWRNGRSTIRLSDPVGGGDVLAVSFGLDKEAGTIDKLDPGAS